MVKMKDMVKETISACEACQKNKVVTTATKYETVELTARVGKILGRSIEF